MKNYILIGLILIPIIIIGCASNEELISQAVEAKDTKICEKISDYYYKYECYSGVALELQNTEICEKIIAESSKTRCYTNIAIKIQDIKICDKLTKYRNQCYNDVAIEKKDIEICKKINVTWEKNSCFRDVGVESKNLDICDEIIVGDLNTYSGMQSLDYKIKCYVWVAIAKKDLEICRKAEIIADGGPYNTLTILRSCYEDVAEVSGDLSICNLLPNEMYAPYNKVHCIKKVAIASENENICENILDQEQKNECYKDVAVKKSDKSICGKIDNKEKKYQCEIFVKERIELLGKNV